MKRSLIFVNVLMLLFIFQSFWNVAASFCQHEIEVQNIEQTQHFGHHQTMNCQQNSKHIAYLQNTDQQPEIPSLSYVLLSSVAAIDDHHDHLPSFAHYIAKEVLLQTAPNLSRHRALDLSFFWDSLYQSPDLSSQTPPPEHTPLLVG